MSQPSSPGTVLITGAAKRIGKALALDLGAQGWKVAVHYSTSQKDAQDVVAAIEAKGSKAVALDAQVLTATSGDRDKPEKLTVEKTGGHFVVPMLKGDEFWIILQFKPTPAAKPITARLHYDAATCEKCKKAEWLCACAKAAAKAK